MKWLSLDLIKKQSRIDYQCEDELLKLYGEAAEETVLNMLGRSFINLVLTYNGVPKPLYAAALMLVDVSYQYRNPISTSHLSIVPYTFDILIKPYILLSNNDGVDELPLGVLESSDGLILTDSNVQFLIANTSLPEYTMVTEEYKVMRDKQFNILTCKN